VIQNLLAIFTFESLKNQSTINDFTVESWGTSLESCFSDPRRHLRWGKRDSRDENFSPVGLAAKGCLSRITRTMHTDYVWHTPALMVSQCVRETEVIEWRNSASGRLSDKS
jgi:hypothetical protein